MNNQANRYSLKEQLGSTGLATVYLAGLQEWPADRVVKIFRPYLASDQELMDSFTEIILEVSHLEHRNIIRVYGKEEEEGSHSIVMEYTPYPSLRQWLKGAMPPEHALWILRQLFDALSYAQQTGIAHGDIKPSNIFIDNEKKFLSKFGIYNKQSISSNFFISGSLNLKNARSSFYEISGDKKFDQDDINFIEKEFNNLVLEDGYTHLFHFPKFKEFIKIITDENN